MDATALSTIRRRPAARHRARLERQGIVWLEVQVREQDAPRPSLDLKALLAAAPLEGIDLERQDDTGRTVALRAGRSTPASSRRR
jgi:hypothetical protein